MNNLRKYRINQETRDKYAEVFIDLNDLIQPYFLVEGTNVKSKINSLYNVFHFSVDKIILEISELIKTGINKILLFGVIPEEKKDDKGTYAYSENNLIFRAVREIKKEFPNIIIFTDVCLCGYTDHGHCGIIKNQDVSNEETLEILSKVAVNHAEAGVDYVSPSAMMDGQVKTIKNVLTEHGFTETKIMSYSTKYASGFYGPFRNAAHSSPSFGDRKTYQLDYRTIGQGVNEAEIDIMEGANIIMVKPAHTYLDMILRIKTKFPKTPLAAYHVSGEYEAINKLSDAGLADRNNLMLEVLTSIKRAGADYIITYYAKEYASAKMNHKY